MHVRAGLCGSQQILKLPGLPVGYDGDEYIAPVYRLLVMDGRGFRNIDTDQRSDEPTGDSAGLVVLQSPHVVSVEDPGMVNFLTGTG